MSNVMSDEPEYIFYDCGYPIGCSNPEHNHEPTMCPTCGKPGITTGTDGTQYCINCEQIARQVAMDNGE